MAILGAFIVPHPPLLIPEVGKGEEKQIKKQSIVIMKQQDK